MKSDGLYTHTFCNRCQCETNHSILHSLGNDRNEGLSHDLRMIQEVWQFLQCNGCESIQVLMSEVSPNSKSPRYNYYPPRQFRRLPHWCTNLSEELQGLIFEIYSALHASCLTLAVMGARTLVDKLLTDKLGDNGGFKQKLNTAVANGFLTQEATEIIAAAVEIGHAATHRGYAPTQEQVFEVLDIVEHFLQGSYVLQDKSRRLNQSVPARGNRY